MPPKKILKTWEVVTTFGFILLPFQGLGVGTLMSFIFLAYNGNINFVVGVWLAVESLSSSSSLTTSIFRLNAWITWTLNARARLLVARPRVGLPDARTTLYCIYPLNPFWYLSKTGWGLQSTSTCFLFFDLSIMYNKILDVRMNHFFGILANWWAEENWKDNPPTHLRTWEPEVWKGFNKSPVALVEIPVPPVPFPVCFLTWFQVMRKKTRKFGPTTS